MQCCAATLLKIATHRTHALGTFCEPYSWHKVGDGSAVSCIGGILSLAKLAKDVSLVTGTFWNIPLTGASSFGSLFLHIIKIAVIPHLVLLRLVLILILLLLRPGAIIQNHNRLIHVAIIGNIASAFDIFAHHS